MLTMNYGKCDTHTGPWIPSSKLPAAILGFFHLSFTFIQIESKISEQNNEK